MYLIVFQQYVLHIFIL